MNLIPFPKTQPIEDHEDEIMVKKTRKRPLSFPLPSFDLKFFAASLKSTTEDTEKYYDSIISHKRLELGIEMLKSAIEADKSHDGIYSAEAYFHAIDLIFSALNNNFEISNDLRNDFTDRLNIHLHKIGIEKVGISKPKSWQEKLVDSSVNFAIKLKQSKLPHFVCSVFILIYRVIKDFNERFQFTSKVLNCLDYFLQLFLQFDHDFDIHQCVSELGFTVWEATVKAAIAFAQAEGYQHQNNNESKSKAKMKEIEESKLKKEGIVVKMEEESEKISN